MTKAKHESATPATVWLKTHGVTYKEHSYTYVEHGGTHVTAQALGFDEHAVVKTLIMQDENAKPLVILMHGDKGRQGANPSLPVCPIKHSAIRATKWAEQAPSARERKCPFTSKVPFSRFLKYTLTGGDAATL